MAKDQVILQKFVKGRKETIPYDKAKYEQRKDLLAKDGYSKVADQVKEQPKTEVKEPEIKNKKKEEIKETETIPETNTLEENEII